MKLSLYAARLILTAGASLTALAASAAQIGPQPTDSSLLAASGPFATKSVRVAAPAGYGSGTVWYPTTAGQYGVVVVAPGFTESESAIKWWGSRLASHGFVAVTLGTKSPLDSPDSRARQMMAALKQVIGLTGTSPYKDKVDGSKRAVAGHSMGGGGALVAARDNPDLKAAIPMAPWYLTKNFSGIKVPTLIVACERDFIAPVASYAQKFYSSIKATTPHALLELAGESHLCPTGTATAASKAVEGKMAVAWLKVFMDGDARYAAFLGTAKPAANISKWLTSGIVVPVPGDTDEGTGGNGGDGGNTGGDGGTDGQDGLDGQDGNF